MPAPTDPNPATPEEIIWSGSPSQATYFGTYILCGLLCPLVIPIFFALWRYLQIRSIHYEITTQRLKITNGLFSKRTEEVELYRVQDTTLEEPFKLRLFHAGNILLATHDLSTPQIVLQALPGAKAIRERLRTAIEAVRDRKRVRMVENE